MSRRASGPAPRQIARRDLGLEHEAAVARRHREPERLQRQRAAAGADAAR